MMSYTCVHKPQCKHYPHTEISDVSGIEWVDFADPRQVATHQQSHHKECISGLHYVTRDGRRVSPYFVNADLAWVWLLKYQPNSVDWALKWEGYAFKTVG